MTVDLPEESSRVRAIALSGDGQTAMVGVPSIGKVRSYHKALGWEEGGVVSNEASTEFGKSLALSGDGQVVLVGAPLTITAGGINSGSVGVYRRDEPSLSWVGAGTLADNRGKLDDNFGWSVDLSGDGDTVVVASRRSDTASGPNTGAVYVFERHSDGTS